MAAIEVVDLLSSPPPITQPAKGSGLAASRIELKPSVSAHVLDSILNDARVRSPPLSSEGFIYISDGDGDENAPIDLPTKSFGPRAREYKAPLRNICNETRSSRNHSVHGKSIEDVNDLGSDIFAVDPFEKQYTASKDSVRKEEDSSFFYLSDDVDDMVKANNLPLQQSTRSIAPAKTSNTSHKHDLGFRQRSPVLQRSTLKRAITDISASSRGVSGTKTTLKRSKTSIEDEEDPILFTSSPDVFRAARERREKAIQERNAILNGSDVISVEGLHRSKTQALSTMDDLSSDIDLPDVGFITASQASTNLTSTKSRPPMTKTSARDPSAKTSAKDKADEKSRKQQEKAEVKAIEAEKKRLLKEEKARNKQIAQDLAKVNTLRTDKKVSTPEMIVDLSSDFDEKLGTQARRLLGNLNVECTVKPSPVPSIIRWRRKVEARYNDELGHWEPVPKHICEEKHILCYVSADEFVKLVTGDDTQDPDAHILRIRTAFPSCEPIYLIEGLTIWMRKNRNIKNRQFTEAVRLQGASENQDVSSSQKSKKRKKVAEYIDEDLIEDALLKLQVMHGALIHHTASTVESAQWVVVFTQHISTIPYRLQFMTLDTAFCMETGQVKTGEDAADTFVKMLQEVARVTAPIAYGIAAEYPSVQALVKGFERNGRDMLQNLKRSANKDGALTDRDIGVKISRRLWSIFTCTDQTSMDI